MSGLSGHPWSIIMASNPGGHRAAEYILVHSSAQHEVPSQTGMRVGWGVVQNAWEDMNGTGSPHK